MMGSETEKQDKLAKLQARKKELEQLLATKNEELYKLCVQEVQLTGVMPPEAPLSPDAPSQRRERLGSVRSVGEKSLVEGDDVRDSSESLNRQRHNHGDSNQHHSKVHRLSTPSISGMSTKSAPARQNRRPETNTLNYYPSPPYEGTNETFSMHVSQTYPSIADNLNRIRSPTTSRESSGVVYRHHTLTSDQINKACYNNNYMPDTQSTSRLKETHFTASHPDIPSQQTHRAPPILFQYATQLRAQSPHLTSLQSSPRRRSDGRRATLQRTQTYHLTAHSDYPSHLANLQTPPIDPRCHISNARRQVASVHLQLDVDTKSPPVYQNLNLISPTSFDNISRHSGDGSDGKVKEKQWYETSLDSPTSSNLPSPSSRSLKRSPSVGNSQNYEHMAPPIPPHAKPAPPAMLSPSMLSPPLLSPPLHDVPLESPKNCTIIEHGKWIPYREETKPFEMSDFYKYSTKFRQANQKTAYSAHQVGLPVVNTVSSESTQFSRQDHWHHH